MARMGKGLGVFRVLRLLTGGLSGIRTEVARLAAAQEALLLLAQRQGQTLEQQQAPLTEGDVEVTYVKDDEQQLWMQVQLDLTRATGQAPTEDEVYAEYMRRIPAWAADRAETHHGR